MIWNCDAGLVLLQEQRFTAELAERLAAAGRARGRGVSSETCGSPFDHPTTPTLQRVGVAAGLPVRVGVPPPVVFGAVVGTPKPAPVAVGSADSVGSGPPVA